MTSFAEIGLENHDFTSRVRCSVCGKRRLCRWLVINGTPGLAWAVCREHSDWRPEEGVDYDRRRRRVIRRSTIRRLRYHLWGIVLIPAAPILIPVLAQMVVWDYVLASLEGRPGRPGWFWVRLWWWYGYHGLYQIDWALKRRGIRYGTVGA